MKERAVIISPEAKADLLALYDWIATAAHPQTALDYIERIEAFCQGMRIASRNVAPAEMTFDPTCAS